MRRAHEADRVTREAAAEAARASLATAPSRRKLAVAGSLAGTGLLMVLAFPDHDLYALVWVALVPFFLCVRGVGWRRGFLYGWLAGVAIEGPGFRWILHSIVEFTDLNGALLPVAFLLFLFWLLYSSLSWALFGVLLGHCRRPAGVHGAIAVWVGVEAFFPRLFPWHLGGAFYRCEWLRQAADLFGASGLSYLVLLATSAIYLTVESRRRRARFPRVTVSLALLLIVAALAYGAFRNRQLEARLAAAPTLRAAVLQPFLRPQVKHGRDPAFFRDLIVASRDLARDARQEGKPLDLIVWPEGIDPLAFAVGAGRDPLAAHTTSPDGGTIFDSIEAPLLVGGSSTDGEHDWGSAAFILPRGAVDPAGTAARARLYHKNKLLLFGEHVPFQGLIPDWLRQRIPIGSLEAGVESPLFELPAEPHGAFRALICYEAVLPRYFRRSSAGADFLVNITEDIWYGPTAHIGQHESVLRMRAIENRIPVLRCTNVGPSGVIDARGAFERRTATWQRDRKVVTLETGAHWSLYRAGGHLFPIGLFILGLAFFLRYNH